MKKGKQLTLVKSTIDQICAVIFDFDGVFTDNSVYIDETGIEYVRCSRADGLGIKMLDELRVPMIVISSEINPVVKIRCKKLGIDCVNGVKNKVQVARSWLSKMGVEPKNTLFVCNDINDIPLMKILGFKWCVNDAWPEVANLADFKLSRKGGYGAVREACEILKSYKGEKHEI